MEERRLGIAGIGKTDWDEHLCVFFKTKGELLNLTVPYIKAGLEDNEFCMWITGEPVTENEAFHTLEQVLPDAHEYLAKKQLEILPHSQWYLSSGIFSPEIVLHNWLSKANQADAEGHAGMRITGNPFWLRSELDWEQFGAYENAVTHRITNERILALCTYPIDICRINNVMLALSCHDTALIGQQGQWRRHEIPPPYAPRRPLT